MRRTLIGLALALLLAGCGGSARPQRAGTPGLPRHLATVWATQADEIAAAAQVPATCSQAQTLAGSLAQEVAVKINRIPARLRTPLLDAVTSLAHSITCASPPTKPKGPPPRKEPKPKEKHGHGHGPHRHGGDGGDGGGG